MWWIIGGFVLVGLGAAIRIVLTAPRGYEDDAGFHYGPFDDEPRCDITGQPLTTQQAFDKECG